MENRPTFAVGTLVSFPSYLGKTFYGQIYEILPGTWYGQDVILAAGPYAPESTRTRENDRRAAPADRVTVLDTPQPQPGQIWSITEDGKRRRIQITHADGFIADATLLGAEPARAGSWMLVGNGWQLEPAEAVQGTS